MVPGKVSSHRWGRGWPIGMALLALVGGCTDAKPPAGGNAPLPGVARPARFIEAVPHLKEKGESSPKAAWDFDYGGGPVGCEVILEEREDDSARKLSPGYVPSETKRSVLFSVEPSTKDSARTGAISVVLEPLASGPNQLKLIVSVRAGDEQPSQTVELPGPFAAGGHGLENVALPGDMPPGLPFAPDRNGKRMLVAFNWFKAEAPADEKAEKSARGGKPKVQMLCIVNAVFPQSPKP